MLFGLALGDAPDTPFEGGLLGQAYSAIYRRLIGKRLAGTDDTAIMINLVESYVIKF